MRPIIVIGSKQEHAMIGSVCRYAPCVASAYGMGGGMTAMILYEYDRDNLYEGKVV